MTDHLTNIKACDLDAGVAINDFARRVSKELAGAAASTDACQEAIFAFIENGASSDLVVRLQALDILSQTLTELANTFALLGATPGLGRAPSALLDPIRLNGLKRRLQGQSGDCPDTSAHSEFW